MNQLQNLAATGRGRMESRHLADHLGEAASRRFCRWRSHLGEAASRRFAWWARSPSARPMWPPRPCKGGASRPGEPLHAPYRPPPHHHLEEPHRRLLRRRRPFNRFPITVPRCPVIRDDMRNMG